MIKILKKEIAKGVWVIRILGIGIYLELACLPVVREFGDWNLSSEMNG
jgi:hypothetical protein